MTCLFIPRPQSKQFNHSHPPEFVSVKEKKSERINKRERKKERKTERKKERKTESRLWGGRGKVTGE